jgi:membrane protein DedA with SNARE-associated domain
MTGGWYPAYGLVIRSLPASTEAAHHRSCVRFSAPTAYVGAMSFEDYMQGFAHAVVEFVRDHEYWAAPVVAALAFGESLAFISLMIPAWAALVAIGVLVAESGINFWPIFFAGAVGAALGDWLSYWVGVKLGPAVGRMWPLSRYPDFIARGEGFVTRWGALAIFIGRFSGPLRASVPLAAGIFAMPFWRFQVANFSSAFVWVAVLLTLGDVVAMIFNLIWR